MQKSLQILNTVYLFTDDSFGQISITKQCDAKSARINVTKVVGKRATNDGCKRKDKMNKPQQMR